MAGSETPVCTHVHRIHSPSIEKRVRNGVQWELWSGCADQVQGMARQECWPATVQTQAAHFIPFPFIFTHSFPPQPTVILPIPHFGFLHWISLKKSCTIPKCSSPASHIVLHPSHRQWAPQSEKCSGESPLGCPPDPGAEGPLWQHRGAGEVLMSLRGLLGLPPLPLCPMTCLTERIAIGLSGLHTGCCLQSDHVQYMKRSQALSSTKKAE